EDIEDFTEACELEDGHDRRGYAGQAHVALADPHALVEANDGGQAGAVQKAHVAEVDHVVVDAVAEQPVDLGLEAGHVLGVEVAPWRDDSHALALLDPTVHEHSRARDAAWRYRRAAARRAQCV